MGESMFNYRTKFGVAFIMLTLGYLCTAGVKLVQMDYKVDDHADQIKTINVKIDQISKDTAFIRGILESNK